jgi:hypothetical protein
MHLALQLLFAALALLFVASIPLVRALCARLIVVEQLGLRLDDDGRDRRVERVVAVPTSAGFASLGWS